MPIKASVLRQKKFFSKVIIHFYRAGDFFFNSRRFEYEPSEKT